MNQVNMTIPKKIDKAPKTDPKKMELYKPSDKIQNNLLKEVK